MEKESKVIVPELDMFTIETSERDILEKTSGFNPFPEKAKGGISVWSIEHPTTNPLVTIRYEASGEMFDTHVPISYPDKELKAPQPLQKAPETIVGAKGEEFGRWIPLHDYMVGLSEDVVGHEASKGDLRGLLAKAVVKRISEDGKSTVPIFETPDDAYLKIAKSSLEAVEEGKWREALICARYGTRVGSYEISGKQYSNQASEVFDYSTRKVAFDAVPSLRQDIPGAKDDSGRWDVVSDTASEINSLITGRVSEKALLSALQEYNSSPTQKGHIEKTLEITRARIANAESRLSEKTSLSGTTYLHQVKEYLSSAGVRLF